MIKSKDVDEYISGYAKDIQDKLKLIRETIRKAAPDSEETIGYAIPTYKVNKKNLVHFAAFKSHIGFYPGPSGMREFKIELSDYKTGKGSVQFPLDKPLPIGLITRIVKFRIKEDIQKTKSKKK